MNIGTNIKIVKLDGKGRFPYKAIGYVTLAYAKYGSDTIRFCGPGWMTQLMLEDKKPDEWFASENGLTQIFSVIVHESVHQLLDGLIGHFASTQFDRISERSVMPYPGYE